MKSRVAQVVRRRRGDYGECLKKVTRNNKELERKTKKAAKKVNQARNKNGEKEIAIQE